MNIEQFKNVSLSKSFGYAFKGLKLALIERNFKLHLLSAFLIITLGFYLKISPNEWMVTLLCIGLVMCMELVNTAIERLVDIVSPEFNEKAGKVKDIAAAAVLMASLVSIIIAVIIFLPYLS